MGRPTAVRCSFAVDPGTPAAENKTVKTRKASRAVAPPVDGDFENWITDLVDGETTARRLRKRLDAAGERSADACTVCEGTATGKIYFGPDGHLHGRISA